MENKLSAERQARLNISDKLDAAQKVGRLDASLSSVLAFNTSSSLPSQTNKTAESEASSLRERVDDLELRLSNDQRALLLTKNQSEAQRKESNELLLAVFQNVNKILGTEVCLLATLLYHLRQIADPDSRFLGFEQERGTTANFAVFKDTLLTRLRSLGQLQNSFEKKIKTTESGFLDKLK